MNCGDKLKKLRLCFVAIASLTLLIAPLETHGDALDTLHLRNPLPTPDALQSVGFGNGKFIAADNRGDVFASADGFTWIPTGNAGTNLLLKIVFGSGRYVAYSFSGNILSSEDGALWAVRSSVPQNSLLDIAYGNGLFVAVGSVVMTSPDGVTWTMQNPVCNCGLFSVTSGNGIFAAVGNINTIYTSVDGVMWTPRFPDAGYTNGSYIAYGNGKFVVSGSTRFGTGSTPGVWHSSNGADWMQVSGAGLGSQGLVHGGGTFLTWSAGPTVTTSADGVTWATNALPSGLALLRVAYGNGIFVSANFGNIGRSSNGLDWVKVAVPAADRSFAVTESTYGNGRYVLVGGGPISGGAGFVVTSSNGVNFTRISNSFFPGLNAVIYAAGQFIVAGQDGALLRSLDGLNWSTSRSGTLQHLRAVVHGAGQYVAVGDGGTIRISEDGIVWNGAASGTDYSLYGVVFADGRFVAVGQRGIVLTSTDGMTWMPRNNADFSTLYHVIHVAERFLAVGGDGAVLSSTDGATWTRHASGISDTINKITYGSGLYIAVSSMSGTYEGGQLVSDGRVFTSADGVMWHERLQPHFGNIAGAALLNNTFLLFGASGTILQSEPVGGAVLALNIANGTVDVTVRSMDIGSSYRLQSCTNLPTGAWFDVTNFTQTQPITIIRRPVGTGTAQCYYRIVSP